MPELTASQHDALTAMARQYPHLAHDAAVNVIHKLPLPELASASELYDAEIVETRGLFVEMATLVELVHPGITLLAARQKLGKSWLTLQLSIATAGGPHPHGLRAREIGKVLYAALEEPKTRTAARLRKLADRGPWLENIVFLYDLLPLMGGGAEQLERLIEEQSPKLLVLDTLSALLKGGGGKSGDVWRQQYAEVRRLQEITYKHNLPCILVHHTRKNGGGDFVEEVAGTGGVTAGVDTIWVLRRRAEGGAELIVAGREVEESGLACEFSKTTPFGWIFHGSAAQVARTEARRNIIEFLRSDGPATPSQIASALGRKQNSVRSILSRMVADGLVVKQEKGGKHEPV